MQIIAAFVFALVTMEVPAPAPLHVEIREVTFGPIYYRHSSSWDKDACRAWAKQQEPRFFGFAEKIGAVRGAYAPDDVVDIKTECEILAPARRA